MESRNYSRQIIAVLAVGVVTILFVLPCDCRGQEATADSTGKMYWTDLGTNKIQRANLDGSNVEDLVTSGLSSPEDIALDMSAGKMYWTEYSYNKIQRANLDGSNVEDVVASGLSDPWGIALDLSGGKMYWVDAGTNKIRRANLDGSNVEDLISTGLGDPYDIAVDPSGGKMYWADYSYDKIQRANLDGSNIEDLVTTGLSGPLGIAVDPSGGKVYWTEYSYDKIQRANLDGSNVEDLVTSGLSSPRHIALELSAGKMYWTEYSYNKIQRANLDGSNVEDLVTTGLSDPAGIAVSYVLDDLRVVPSDGLISSGDVGGPFVPGCQTYTLTNTSANSLDWTASKTQSWLSLAPTGGRLEPNDSNTVDVCINASASFLPIGVYTDTVTFSNLTSGVDQSRNVVLTVRYPEVKLIASDGYSSDYFGYSVSIDGDYAVVGAHYDDDKGSSSGSAYIFERSGTGWVQQAKLTASDGYSSDYFGYSVSIDGDYCIVGAYGDDDKGSSSGSAYIFQRSGTIWVEQAKLTASDGYSSDYFGYSVSINGDYCIAGAPYDDDKGSSSGSAYIFGRSGTSWVQQAKLTASDGYSSDNFGRFVSIDGDYAVVGAPYDDDKGSSSGSAYIFQRSGTIWVEQDKLTASDGYSSDYFGWSVSISGDYCVLGTYGDDDKGSSSGSAYIFQRSGTSWVQQAKLTASDGASDDNFGRSVSIDGDHCIAGAPYDDDKGSSSGSAYVFKRSGTSWTEQNKLTASDGYSSDYFGYSVSVSDEQPIVGAYCDDDNGTDSGSAYVFGRADDLTVAAAVPPEDFNSVGDEGGPFEPNSKDYILTNIGANSLDWNAQLIDCPWLDVNQGNGTLPAGADTTVTVSLNASVYTLDPNVYTGTITFTNLTSGEVHSRGATLRVVKVPGEIEVTDSIPPVDDNEMPFGEVVVGLSRTEHITIANTDPNHELIVDIQQFEGFYDEFPTTTIDAAKWTSIISYPTIDDVGLGEPSPPYSLRLNGDPDGGDAVESCFIDLSGLTGVQLTYWYEQTGGGEHPDSGEDLIFEYWSGSDWVEFARQFGDGPDMTDYVQSTVPLPAGALHENFRLRIRSIGSYCACDDWFVDDVSITMTGQGLNLGRIPVGKAFWLENVPNLPATIQPSGQITLDVNFIPEDIADYNSTLFIRSDDRDEPEVAVRLTGTGILDYLEIAPDANFVFSGHPGGPFVPTYETYQLTNIGLVSIDWTAAPNVPWLDVSPLNGSLIPGGSITVTISPNAQANIIPEGYHYGEVIFTDVTTTLRQVRKVYLDVYTEPKIWVSPWFFNVTVPQGNTETRILTIGNNGESVLNFNLSGSQTDFTPAPALESVSGGAVSQIETSEDGIVFEYEFDEPSVRLGDPEYDVIEIEGLETYERVGAPIVPVRPVRVLIPFGKEMSDCRVILLDAYDLEGSYLLAPGQRPYPFSYTGDIEPNEPDPNIYNQSTPWPGMDYEEIGTHSKRGYQVFNLNLFPLQYVPSSGTISYSINVRLEIDLVDSLGAEVLLRPSTKTESALSTMVDNPSGFDTDPVDDSSTQTVGDEEVLASGGLYEYVIITNQALKSAPGPSNFQALRDAKIAKGITATIVTTDWIYANYDGARPDGGTDNQTRIRNFLIDAYQNWGTEYVLLGGTNNIVPARMFYVDGEIMPVDMYYGCVEPSSCTFDYDADGYYGEPTDGVGGGDVDLYTEIYVGRAPIENATELANFISKTLAYASSHDRYLSRISMVGEYLGFGGPSEYAKDSMEQIRLGGNYDGYFTYGFENHVEEHFYDFNTIDCLPNNPSTCWPLYDRDSYWSESKLLDLMNGGIHILNHLGHANYTYCMKLYNSDLASLTNTDYFFVYSQGCYPGGFDTSNCFGEVITSMEHGAFAVVMNARYGWGKSYSTDGPSQRFARQFWDAVLNEDMLELGSANQDSKEDNLWDINGSYIRWCYYELNLFGDPEQQFRLAEMSDWIEFEPDAGSVGPNEVNDVLVVFDGNRPGGTYEGQMIVLSNDPYESEITIPVTMTVEGVDYFTELFEPNDPFDPNDLNSNDMTNKVLAFKPNSSSSYYSLCLDEATSFPVDPNGGTIVTLTDDDYIIVELNNVHMNFYGTDYDTFYIGSNGYITFASGDIHHHETLADHFDLPRISALFDDLDPSAGGTISWSKLDDRVVITFENVPEYGLSNSNNFQVEIFFDGKVRITLLDIAVEDGLVGLSDGYGVPLYFNQSDLSAYNMCNFICDLNRDLKVDMGDFAIFSMDWQNTYDSGTIQTVRDEFNTISYSGNDGTVNWSDNWQELGESDGPRRGVLQTVNRMQNGLLRIGDESKVFHPVMSLTREANLSGATVASLTYQYYVENTGNAGSVSVKISRNGGANWDTLATYNYNAGSGYENFDISSYISSNTQIRFETGSEIRMHLFVDNIQIEYDQEPRYHECDFNGDLNIDYGDLLIFCDHYLE